MNILCILRVLVVEEEGQYYAKCMLPSLSHSGKCRLLGIYSRDPDIACSNICKKY